MKYLRLLTVLLVLLIGYDAVPAVRLNPENVRVAIVKGLEEVKVDGEGILATDEKGMPQVLSFPLTVKRASNNFLSASGRQLRRLTVASPSVLRLNSKGYRGVLEFFPTEKGVLVVNELPLEEYLVGLINCEISSLWPIEAVKAQAVIARSYAVYQKDIRNGSLYHLESSVMDQVYDGADIEDSRAARAVRETSGEVLVYSGKIIQAFYHANCGGHTEAAMNVWGANLPYLKGVDCKYCINTPPARWEQTISLKKIESLLRGAGYQVGTVRGIKPGKYNFSGRMQNLTVVSTKGELLITAVNFRKVMGFSVLKSTNFTVRPHGDEIVFTGSGNGHGVGLCQWGAKQRAGDGFNYREIVSYYYPGVTLEKLKN